MYVSGIAGPEEAKNLAGKCPPPVSDPFSAVEFGKIASACQDKISRQKGCNHESPILIPTNAVNFSSARTTKRFPSPRCASAAKIVRPAESNADTQPQLQPALLRLSAMISQYFMLRVAPLCRTISKNSERFCLPAPGSTISSPKRHLRQPHFSATPLHEQNFYVPTV
jgi:hypothetical protein